MLSARHLYLVLGTCGRTVESELPPPPPARARQRAAIADRGCWCKLYRCTEANGPEILHDHLFLKRGDSLESQIETLFHTLGASDRLQRTPTPEYTIPSSVELLTATWSSAASTHARALRSVAGLAPGAVRGGWQRIPRNR